MASGTSNLSFTEFVLKQATNAGVFLGQRENPITGEKGINLRAAKGAIDVLELLQDKTGGNLSADETVLLRDTLGTLQGLYEQISELEPDDE